MYKHEALGIIDAEHCFFPEKEGYRLGLPGFGELGVEGAEKIIDPINLLTHYFRRYNRYIFDTRDQHPEETAHFAPKGTEPNFINTWPPHGRANTPGGELHPDLLIAQHPSIVEDFIKGDVVARTPAEDTSYTGALAHNKDGLLLPDALRERNINSVTLTGLALGDAAENKLCVDATAVDLLNEGFEVTVVSDAVEAVLPQNRELCLQRMGAMGIKIATTAEVLALLQEAYEV